MAAKVLQDENAGIIPSDHDEHFQVGNGCMRYTQVLIAQMGDFVEMYRA